MTHRTKHNIWKKTIAMGVLCLFLVNQFAWAHPSDALAPPTGLGYKETSSEIVEMLEDEHEADTQDQNLVMKDGASQEEVNRRIKEEQQVLIAGGQAIAWRMRDFNEIIKILKKDSLEDGDCARLLSLAGFPPYAKEQLKQNLRSPELRNLLICTLNIQRHAIADILKRPGIYLRMFRFKYRGLVRRNITELKNRKFVLFFSGDEGFFARAQTLGNSTGNSIAMHMRGVRNLPRRGLGAVLLHEHMDLVRGKHDRDMLGRVFQREVHKPWRNLRLAYDSNYRARRRQEDTNSGIGSTSSGIFPHRGYREGGTINDEILGTIVGCITDGSLIESSNGRISLDDQQVRNFLFWYENSSVGDEPKDEGEEIDFRISIDKLADPDIEITAIDGRRLRVVRLPVERLGVIDGEPFYGHIGLREGVIWVADKADPKRLALRIMHEEQEYNCTLAVAEVLNLDMETMAFLRDNPEAVNQMDSLVAKGLTPYHIQMIFEVIHAHAWQRVEAGCTEDFVIAASIGNIDSVMDMRNRANGHYTDAIEALHLEQFAEDKTLNPIFAEFGIGQASSELPPSPEGAEVKDSSDLVAVGPPKSLDEAIVVKIKACKTAREVVATLMKHNGWNQKQTAQAAGLSPKTMQRILSSNNSRKPEQATLKALADAFGVEGALLLRPEDTAKITGEVITEVMALLTLKERGEKLCSHKGWNLTRLSEEAGIPFAVIWRLFGTGETTKPQQKTVRKLSQAFDNCPEEVFVIRKPGKPLEDFLRDLELLTTTGDKIKAARRYRDLTIAELAMRTEISKGVIHLMEKNEIPHTEDRLIAIAGALQLEPRAFGVIVPAEILPQIRALLDQADALMKSGEPQEAMKLLEQAGVLLDVLLDEWIDDRVRLVSLRPLYRRLFSIEQLATTVRPASQEMPEAAARPARIMSAVDSVLMVDIPHVRRLLSGADVFLAAGNPSAAEDKLKTVRWRLGQLRDRWAGNDRISTELNGLYEQLHLAEEKTQTVIRISKETPPAKVVPRVLRVVRQPARPVPPARSTPAQTYEEDEDTEQAKLGYAFTPGRYLQSMKYLERANIYFEARRFRDARRLYNLSISLAQQVRVDTAYDQHRAREITQEASVKIEICDEQIARHEERLPTGENMTETRAFRFLEDELIATNNVWVDANSRSNHLDGEFDMMRRELLSYCETLLAAMCRDRLLGSEVLQPRIDRLRKEMTRRVDISIRELAGNYGRGPQELGAGISASGVLPHRGYRPEGVVNDQTVMALESCLDDLIADDRLQLEESDVAEFRRWYREERVSGDDVPPSAQIDISKLAVRQYRRRSDGRRLWLVELPVPYLGIVDGEPFFAHVGFTRQDKLGNHLEDEAIIWVAAGSKEQPRSVIDVQVDLVHEFQEYCITAKKAREWGWTMRMMSDWRDGVPVDAEPPAMVTPLDFFDEAHVLACHRTAKIFRKEYRLLSATLPKRSKVRRNSYRRYILALDIYRNAIEAGPSEMASGFGIGIASKRDHDDEDPYFSFWDSVPDPHDTPLHDLIEGAREEMYHDEDTGAVLDFIAVYVSTAKRLQASADPDEVAEGQKMLRIAIPMSEFHRHLEAVAGKFSFDKFVRILADIFSPSHVMIGGKPKTSIRVADFWKPKKEEKTLVDSEGDELVYVAHQIAKAHDDLIRGSSKVQVGELLALTVVSDTSHELDEQIASQISREDMLKPDLEMARAIVKAVPRDGEIPTVGTIQFDTYQIEVVDQIIELNRAQFDASSIEERRDDIRFVLLEALLRRIPAQQAAAMLLRYMSMPNRHIALVLAKQARDAGDAYHPAEDGPEAATRAKAERRPRSSRKDSISPDFRGDDPFKGPHYMDGGIGGGTPPSPEEIAKKGGLGPKELSARIIQRLQAQEECLASVEIDKEFQDTLPGTICITHPKPLGDMRDHGPIDQARRIIKGKFFLPTPEPELSEFLNKYIEAPAHGLVRRIIEVGGKPTMSNAYGNNVVGVWWSRGVESYFTPLTIADYAKAGVEFYAIGDGPKGATPQRMQGVNDQHMARKAGLVRESLTNKREVIIPRELIPEKFWEELERMRREEGFADDIKVVSWDEAKRMATNAKEGENRTIILDPTMEKEIGKNCKATRVVLTMDKKRNFLYLHGGIAIARAINAGDDDLIKLFYHMMTNQTAGETVMEELINNRRLSLPLPEIEKPSLDIYDELEKEAFIFLKNA